MSNRLPVAEEKQWVWSVDDKSDKWDESAEIGISSLIDMLE
jgi:hypothetical protein